MSRFRDLVCTEIARQNFEHGDCDRYFVADEISCLSDKLWHEPQRRDKLRAMSRVRGLTLAVSLCAGVERLGNAMQLTNDLAE